jgi:putative endonuclease
VAASGKAFGVILAQARIQGCKRMPFYVYILASRRNGTLYVGVTNNLARRVQEHRNGAVAGFTKRYGVKTLVYFEVHDTIEQAILREKRIKVWKRKWKLEAIENMNSAWRDLFDTLNS